MKMIIPKLYLISNFLPKKYRKAAYMNYFRNASNHNIKSLLNLYTNRKLIKLLNDDEFTSILPYYFRRDNEIFLRVKKLVTKLHIHNKLINILVDKNYQCDVKCDPDFIIIGEMRAGTSYLASLIDDFYDVNKVNFEVRFFKDNQLKLNLQQYASLLAYCKRDKRLIYEKSSNYSQSINEIKSLYPQTILLYIIRDPYERIISHYHHYIKRSKMIEFEYFKKNDVEHCISRSLYYNTVQLLNQNQDLVILLDELKTNPSYVINQISEKLGLGKKKSSSYNSKNSRKRIDKEFPFTDNEIIKLNYSIDKLHELLGKNEVLIWKR